MKEYVMPVATKKKKKVRTKSVPVDVYVRRTTAFGIPEPKPRPKKAPHYSDFVMVERAESTGMQKRIDGELEPVYPTNPETEAFQEFVREHNIIIERVARVLALTRETTLKVMRGEFRFVGKSFQLAMRRLRRNLNL